VVPESGFAAIHEPRNLTTFVNFLQARVYYGGRGVSWQSAAARRGRPASLPARPPARLPADALSSARSF
jgi:hypothetical protein